MGFGYEDVFNVVLGGLFLYTLIHIGEANMPYHLKGILTAFVLFVYKRMDI